MIAYLRIVRPGSVIGPQQQYLVNTYARMVAAGSHVPLPFHPETSVSSCVRERERGRKQEREKEWERVRERVSKRECERQRERERGREQQQYLVNTYARMVAAGSHVTSYTVCVRERARERECVCV